MDSNGKGFRETPVSLKVLEGRVCGKPTIKTTRFERVVFACGFGEVVGGSDGDVAAAWWECDTARS